MKAPFIVQTDAHWYKIVKMLKHLKLWHLHRHISVHAGAIIKEQSCAWLKLQMWFLCCVRRYRRGQYYGGISACCAGVWFTVEERTEFLPLPLTTRLHNRLLCRHNIDHRYNDEHNKETTFVVLAKHKIAPWWWFLREPKHVGVNVTVLSVWHFYDFISACISWNDKKYLNISTIYVYNKTSIKRNILTIKQNTSGRRSG